MAKGDFRLVTAEPYQAVASHGRRFGVMFNPSSSRSRLRVIDSGRRYAVRLSDAAVEYMVDGEGVWKPIVPSKDPCTGEQMPAFVSFNETRAGQPLASVAFDMIAVGRGRIVAKEAGTDRLFHLVMDELFRTRRVVGAGCDIDVDRDSRTEDPSAPGFYMKLDPEYFLTSPPTMVVPVEVLRNYGRHPASLRLAAFRELLELGVADLMLVMQRARTWYLIDARSPQSIISADDLRFTEEDFQDVFTTSTIWRIIDAGLEPAHDPIGSWVRKQQIDFLADAAAKSIREGFAGLVLPAYAAFGLLLLRIRELRALRTEDGRLLLDLARLVNAFPPNPALSAAVTELMRRSRRRATGWGEDAPGMPTANQPPPDLATYLHTRYVPQPGEPVVRHLAAAPLTDHRIQLWAADASGAVFTTWKLTDNSNSSWEQWHDFDAEVTGLPAGGVQALAAAPLSDRRLQLWVIANSGRVYSCTKVTADPNSGWTGWSEFLPGGSALAPASRRMLAVAPLPNGAVQLWAADDAGRVFSTWNDDVDASAWAPWEDFLGEAHGLPAAAMRQLAVAPVSNGALQLWAADSVGRLYSTWKVTADPDADWTPWSNFLLEAPGLPPAGLRTLAVAPLPDRRLQLWAADDAGHLYSCWKRTTHSNADWTPFTDFRADAPPLPAASVHDLTVAPLSDGRLQLWVADPSGGSFTTWKATTASTADWSAWDDFLADVRGSRTVANRYAIRFSKVLDLGVGYSHWSEQWLEHFGGEIHSLLARRPFFQQERYNLTQYRILNGPVVDGDAFNDGTTNFYVLVELGDGEVPPTSNKYAILWLDEQTYFTQRWRLLDPDGDVTGDLFSLGRSLADNPAWFSFDHRKFWSPFQGDAIDDRSRMLVRRQIVAVTGYNTAASRHEIYTICFNYGVSDYTWRWRTFPPGNQVVIDVDHAQDETPPFPAEMTSGPANAYVAVNTIDLRDDTTLHVRGTKRLAAGQPLRKGLWVQRYLPADCRHHPTRHELTAADPAPKPAVGFSHPWEFVSEAAYQRADRYYQFGVYKDNYDSRCQYYELDLLPSDDGTTPPLSAVVAKTWRNDADVAGPAQPLHHNTTNFTWDIARHDDAIDISGPALLEERRIRPSMSMYEPTTRFRLLDRGRLGLIAVYYDKRDDDLQGASDLPHVTRLLEDFEDLAIPPEWQNESGGVAHPPTPTPHPPAKITVLVKCNRRVVRPPNIRKAQVTRANRELHVSFWTPQTDDEITENIWRVTLAAIDDAERLVTLFSVPCQPNFVRRAHPNRPLPYNSDSVLTDPWRFDYVWRYPPAMASTIARYCTPAGHIDYGTSLWFENVVGHCSRPEELVFG